MLFEKMKEAFDTIVGEGQEMFAKITNKAQFTRIVQTCYLMGVADGEFDGDEKKALAGLISKKMPQFNIADITSCIDDASKLTDFDLDAGKNELIGNITKASGDDAEQIVQAAIMIGKADGDFDYNEKALVRQLAEGMGVNARKYGLA